MLPLRFSNRRARALLTIASLVFISACQHQLKPSEPEPGVWLSDAAYFTEHSARRSQVQSWRYAAKIGLTTPMLREQANLVWQYNQTLETAPDNEVRLFGPLGVGAVRMQFDENGAVLFDQKGRAHYGDSAEQLLNRIVGWPIPVDALSAWLFSMPSSAAPFRYQLGEDQHLAILEQLGWRIEYSAYRDYSGEFMPRKIIASRVLLAGESEKGGTIIVKLITKSMKQPHKP